MTLIRSQLWVALLSITTGAMLVCGASSEAAAAPKADSQPNDPFPAGSLTSPDLQRYAFSAGAVASAGGHALRATVGESGAAGLATGPGIRMSAGFWNVILGSVSTHVPPDIVPDLALRNGLEPSFPNPFRQGTTIEYTIARSSPVTLTVFDVTGRRVSKIVDRHQAAGRHAVRWDGRNSDGANVASGTYFYRLDVDGWTSTERVLRVR